MAPSQPVRLVIFDLDGTLIDSGAKPGSQSVVFQGAGFDTRPSDSEEGVWKGDPLTRVHGVDPSLFDVETLVLEAARTVLEAHGRALTTEVREAASGRKPLDAWQTTIDILGIKDVNAQQLFEESEKKLKERWEETQLMPGAGRLLWHLHRCNVPMALATSTSRDTLTRKMTAPALQGIHSVFKSVRCGDEVTHGKPAPECFLSVAAKMQVPAEWCLVFEDAPSGVAAAHAAGMRIVVVPSLTNKDAYPAAIADCKAGVCAVLPSLFDFRPEAYGLPPFTDYIAGCVVPLEPVWRIRGIVVKGFGRGSKELGIPTANLDSASLQGALAEAVTGIYCGWASIGSSSAVYAMVMSIGWNPFYKNAAKTAEPWLLHDFEQDFYGEELRLVVVGYIRPEANFESLEALISRIHEDARVTKEALTELPLAACQRDNFLLPHEAPSRACA